MQAISSAVLTIFAAPHHRQPVDELRVRQQPRQHLVHRRRPQVHPDPGPLQVWAQQDLHVADQPLEVGGDVVSLAGGTVSGTQDTALRANSVSVMQIPG